MARFNWPSRQALALLVVVVLVAAAGCSNPIGGDSSGTSGDAELVEYVPGDSDIVMHLDGEILTDRETRTVVDAFIAADSSGESTTVDEALSEVTEDTGFDPSSFDEAVAYGQSDEQGDSIDNASGIIVTGDWSEAQLATALEEESDSEYGTESYSGYTIYYEQNTDPAEDPSYIGVINNDTFVLGEERSVKAALDVANGDADELSGPLREEYDATSDGLATITMELPEEETSAYGATSPGSDGPFADVNIVSLVYSTPDGDVQSDIRMKFGNESSASEAGQQLNTALSLYQSSIENEQAREELDNVDVSTDGDVMTISHSTSADRLAQYITLLGQSSFGEEPEQQPPTVQFDWSTEDGDVVAMHYGGDNVPASELQVVDENGDPIEATVNAGDDDTLQAGEEIVISDTGDASEVQLVWTGGDDRAVLSVYDIPDQ